MLEIRTILTQDAEAILHLSEQLGYPGNIENTKRNIKEIISRKDHEAFVAVINNKVVGWIHLQRTLPLESSSFIQITGLVVDKDHRRHGIGKQLVQHGINWTKKYPLLKLRVTSNIKRAESHDFYKSIGFVEIKQQKVYELTVK